MSVPLSGNKNEVTIFNFLKNNMNLNTAAACGVLANIEKESGFRPDLVEYGYSFSNGGYGICQWTNTPRGASTGRKTKLVNYCKNNGLDYKSLNGQLNYLKYELENSYSSVLSVLKKVPNTAQGAFTAGYKWCYSFEVPAGYNTGVSDNRGASAKNKYYPEYHKYSPSSTNTITGDTIVKEAIKLLGKQYKTGNYGVGPDSFDSPGFVKYVYKKAASIELPRTSYEQYKSRISTKGTKENSVPSSLKAGDILFFRPKGKTDAKSIEFSAIATGSGSQFIGCMGQSPKLKVSYYKLDEEVSKGVKWKDLFYTSIRLITDEYTSGTGDSSYLVAAPIDATTGLAGGSELSEIGFYNTQLEDALKVITKSGNKYSTIIDLKNNKELRFYAPITVSESVPVSWSSPATILGRSVPILGYDSTGPRSLAIDLELYAGEYYRPGIVNTDNDPVGTLHKDLDFLKSLEYPDYSASTIEPPPIVLLSIGETLKIRGVISNLSISHNKPYDNRNRSMYVSVSFTCTQVSDNPPGRLDILNRTNISY